MNKHNTKEDRAIKRLLADMEKVGLRQNDKYVNVKDMYSAKQLATAGICPKYK